MLIKNGKIQFLFWTAFFSIAIYLMIIFLAIQTFVLPNTPPETIPQETIIFFFILYASLIVLSVAGTFVATLIDNKYYRKFFGIIIMISLLTFLVVKSIFG
jgi:hypothetical protein